MPAFDPSQPYEDIGLGPRFDPSRPYEDVGLVEPPIPAPSAPQIKRRSLLSQLGSGISRAAFGEDVSEDTPQVAAVRQQFEALKKPVKFQEDITHNEQVDAALKQALKDEFGIERISPAAEIGKGLEKAGKYTRAGVADIAEAYVGNPPGTEPLEPFRNIKAAQRGQRLPVEEDIEALPRFGQIASGTAFNIVESAPKLAAAAALERVGIPAPLAVAAPFSMTPKGFSAEEAIKMGLFPVVSKVGGAAAESAVAKLGIDLPSVAALNAVKALGSTVLVTAYVHAISLPEYARMTPREREDAILSNTAMILAFEAPKYLGLLKGKVVEDKVNAAIMKELEERGNLAAALERGTQTIPGAERVLPQLPGEKANVQPPPPIENAPTPQQQRAPVNPPPVPPETTAPVGPAAAGAVPGEVERPPNAIPERKPETLPVGEASVSSPPVGEEVRQSEKPPVPQGEPKAPTGPLTPEPTPEPVPAPESVAPVMRELGVIIVQANLKAGRAKLQRVENDPAFNRAIGVVPGTGRIRVNPDLLAKDTAGLTPDQRAEYLKRVVNEEIVHNAGGTALVDAWNKIPENGRPTFADFFKDYHQRIHAELTPEQIAETVRRYGADIANDPVQVVAEFIRMKVQDAMEGKRTEEPLTPGVVAHLKALLRRLQEWVKEISGNKQLSGLAREHIKAIKDLLKAAEAPPKEVVKQLPSKTFKLGVERAHDIIDEIASIGKIRGHEGMKPGS